MTKIVDLEVFESLIYWMIRFASIADGKQTFKGISMVCFSKKHGQLFGIHIFILFLKLDRKFSCLIFCGIRSHIFVSRLVIDSFSMPCKTRNMSAQMSGATYWYYVNNASTS